MCFVILSTVRALAQEVFEDWVQYRGTQNYILKTVVDDIKITTSKLVKQ